MMVMTALEDVAMEMQNVDPYFESIRDASKDGPQTSGDGPIEVQYDEMTRIVNRLMTQTNTQHKALRRIRTIGDDRWWSCRLLCRRSSQSLRPTTKARGCNIALFLLYLTCVPDFASTTPRTQSRIR